ncbi:hypothetical protein GHK86_08315, partial [Acidimicrobiaceae bacterium USS-CC1]|nr:hypothetical protein [Acidiferrimicrobium australe]
MLLVVGRGGRGGDPRSVGGRCRDRCCARAGQGAIIGVGAIAYPAEWQAAD